MSQSLSSTNEITNLTDSSVKTASVVPKKNEINVERTPKRAIPDEQHDEVKKLKVEHQSVNEPLASTVPKYITATEVASARTIGSIQQFPEISDEELLQMAIQFEKEHPY